ncbi:MAG: dephospho-CoA kinase [Acidobacteriota bacterium]
MLVAALTGNYGMGKSFVLSAFRDMGAVTLDSDRVVELLLKEAGVIEEVRKLLGSDVVAAAGVLDKKAVAAKIFHDPELKKRLEEIIHPLVFERVSDFIGRIKEKNRVVIVEVPLLFEGHYQGDFSKVITVYAPEEAAIARLENFGVTREEALLRLRSQLPIEEKKARADYLIDNGGSKEETLTQVAEVYRLLCEETKRGGTAKN